MSRVRSRTLQIDLLSYAPYLRRKDISPADILGGDVPWPDDECGLHALLDELCSAPAAGAPAAAPAAASAAAPAAAPAAA